ncbi:MAG: VanZ family protein [Oscillospiraceae bacterium]|nr:VanZ family protein [Oscillospiraceae bacterium]
MPFLKNKRNLVFALLSLGWMGLIFSLSAQSGEVSQSLSEETAWTAFLLFLPGFKEMSTAQQQLWIESIQFALRKGAHFCLYAVLAMLLAGAFWNRERPFFKTALFAWGTATLYAAVDELHQLLVPGRSGEVRDILIDSAGAAAGLLFCAAVLWIVKKAARNRAA